MVAIVSKNILRSTSCAVDTEGELVVIKLGNVTLKLGYEDGLKLSQWIRVRSKQAKARAGDVSRHWSAIGILSDANQTRG